jgi:hypothetical protein
MERNPFGVSNGGFCMIIYLSLLVAILGVLCFALATNPKLVKIGEIAYACGLLAFLLVSVPHLVTLVPH